MSKVYTVHAGKKIEVRDNSYQYLGYYLIEWNGEECVFNSFKKACDFCAERTLDPNHDIKTNSIEVFQRCKELALFKLRELNRTRELLHEAFQKALDESGRMDKEIEEREIKLSKQRDLLAQVELEVLKENRMRQSGVVHGIYEAMQVLETQREPYWNITYNVSSWRKR